MGYLLVFFFSNLGMLTINRDFYGSNYFLKYIYVVISLLKPHSEILLSAISIMLIRSTLLLEVNCFYFHFIILNFSQFHWEEVSNFNWKPFYQYFWPTEKRYKLFSKHFGVFHINLFLMIKKKIFWTLSDNIVKESVGSQEEQYLFLQAFKYLHLHCDNFSLAL